MKTFIFFTICFLSLNSIQAQTGDVSIDQRLIDVYGNTRIVQMAAEQPQFVSYLNFYVNNAYQIVTDVPERKLVNFEDISTLKNTRTGESVSADDLGSLNVLLLNIKRKNDQYVTYKVGETGTVVVFIAPQFLVNEFNSRMKMEGKQ